MPPSSLFSCFRSAENDLFEEDSGTPPPCATSTCHPFPDKTPRTAGKEGFGVRLKLAMNVLCSGELPVYPPQDGGENMMGANHSAPSGGGGSPGAVNSPSARVSASIMTSMGSSRKAAVAAAAAAEAEEQLSALYGARTKSMSKSVTFHSSVTDKGSGMRGVAALLAARDARATLGVQIPPHPTSPTPDSPDNARNRYSPSQPSKSILKHTTFVGEATDHEPVTTNQAILCRQETPYFKSIPKELSSEPSAPNSSIAAPYPPLEGCAISQDGYSPSELGACDSHSNHNTKASSRSKRRTAARNAPSSVPPLPLRAVNAGNHGMHPQDAETLHFDDGLESPRTHNIRILTRMQTPYSSSAHKASPACAGADPVGSEVGAQHFSDGMESPRTRNQRVVNRMQTPFNSGHLRLASVDAAVAAVMASAAAVSTQQQQQHFDDAMLSPRTRNQRILQRTQTPYAHERGQFAVNRKETAESDTLSRFSPDSNTKLEATINLSDSDVNTDIVSGSEMGMVETGLASFSGPVLGAALLRLVEGKDGETSSVDDMSEGAVMQREISEAIALARSGAKLIRQTSEMASVAGSGAGGSSRQGDIGMLSKLPTTNVDARPASLPGQRWASHTKPPLPWPPVGLSPLTKPVGPLHGLSASRVPPRRQSHWAEDTVLAALLLSQELKRVASRATSHCVSEVATEGPESTAASTRTSRASGLTNMSTATAFAAMAMASVVSRSVSMASRASLAGNQGPNPGAAYSANANGYAQGGGSSIAAAAARAVASVSTLGAHTSEPVPWSGNRPRLAELAINGRGEPVTAESPRSPRRLLRSPGSQRSRLSSVHDDDDSAADDDLEDFHASPSPIHRRQHLAAGQIAGQSAVQGTGAPPVGQAGAAANLSEGGWRPASACVPSPLQIQNQLVSGPACLRAASLQPQIDAHSLALVMQRDMHSLDNSRTSDWVQAVAERAASAAAAAAAQAWAEALSSAQAQNLSGFGAWREPYPSSQQQQQLQQQLQQQQQQQQQYEQGNSSSKISSFPARSFEKHSSRKQYNNMLYNEDGSLLKTGNLGEGARSTAVQEHAEPK